VRVRALPVPTPDIALDEDWDDDPENVDQEAAGRSNGSMAQSDELPPTNGGYVVVAIDVTEREELATDRERLYAIQKEVTQSLIEQNNRLRELTQMKDDVVPRSPTSCAPRSPPSEDSSSCCSTPPPT